MGYDRESRSLDHGGGAGGEASTSSVPGKHTQTEALHESAARGVSGQATALPFADQIQSSFGCAIDVSSIGAHVGGAATAAACDDLGASAYASGDQVAFAKQPDLHTAAHEAAHVVQQAHGVNLYGGIGEAGDAYEQHADAVADRVVAGQSASDLFQSGPLANYPTAPGVQRKIAAPQPIIQKKDEPNAPPADHAAAGGGAKVAKLHLFVDIEAPSIGVKELKEGAVGHTWIALEYNDPATVPATVNAAHLPLLRTAGKYADPMGFWPDIQNNVFYSTNVFSSYVQGWMRHPDRAHEGQEKAMQTWELTQAEVDAVIAYAESKRGAKYSVYFFNCTTFGVEAVKAAGKSAPSGGFGVMYPNALYDSIKKRNQKGQGDTMVKDFDGQNESVVHGADAQKKG